MKANVKDNLLVTMGMHAGHLLEKGVIEIPVGLEGEDVLADFCVESVEVYKNARQHGDHPFDLFCDDVLRTRFKACDYDSVPSKIAGTDQARVVALPKNGCGEEPLNLKNGYTVYEGTLMDCVEKVAALFNSTGPIKYDQWSCVVQRN